jgi:hypothetical protein
MNTFVINSVILVVIFLFFKESVKMDKIGHEDIKILNNRKFTKTLFSTKFNN